MLAELIDGHDVYDVEGYALAVPQAFSTFVSAIHIDYNEDLGDYEVNQVIME